LQVSRVLSQDGAGNQLRENKLPIQAGNLLVATNITLAHPILSSSEEVNHVASSCEADS
jgi:hypothetical protein